MPAQGSLTKSIKIAFFSALLTAVALAASALAGGAPAAEPPTQTGTGASMSMDHGAHMQMVAQRTLPTSANRPGAGTVRTYFIAADEIDWDYAPQGRNLITGEPFGETENVFVRRGPDRIGSVYKKAVYREYTDASFTALKPRSDRWQHLGLLGPVIRAEVGDTIRVVFKNNASRPYSVHPHGVFYAKDSEGAPYSDGTSGADKLDDAVAPGDQYVYTWLVPERAGPGPADGNSVMWMYHSHVQEAEDVNTGLMGPMIITVRGQSRPDGTPVGVDREFVANFSVMDENMSHYLADNIARLDDPGVDPEDEEFHESNLMHSINGYVYGNGPGPNDSDEPLFRARKGERIRWYLMAMGTEVDLHTPHWHGTTVTAMGMRTDVVSLLPATMVTADMTADNAGIWFFHCHVNDHFAAGMSSRFEITG
jgi:FtsP/CotA-like multicopper oxidase with cupredoxin domain